MGEGSGEGSGEAAGGTGVGDWDLSGGDCKGKSLFCVCYNPAPTNLGLCVAHRNPPSLLCRSHQ